MPSTLPKRLNTSLLTMLLIALCGCGWHLRGWQSASSATPLQAVNLMAKDRYAPLTLALLDAMQQRAIKNQQDAQLILQLSNEELTKRTVAVTSIGSPSQYEMSLSVAYRYWQAGQTEATLPVTASAFRVFDFDPSNTVAKTEEENTLLNEMRHELAHRILQKAPR